MGGVGCGVEKMHSCRNENEHEIQPLFGEAWGLCGFERFPRAVKSNYKACGQCSSTTRESGLEIVPNRSVGEDSSPGDRVETMKPADVTLASRGTAIWRNCKVAWSVRTAL